MALIGISGKIGSGKDTVFYIINYLMIKYKYTHLWVLNEYENNFNKYLEHHQSKSYLFQNKKFADKLKDIVCLLLGCTRVRLEDREFKEKELGEEWKVYYGKLPDSDIKTELFSDYYDLENKYGRDTYLLINKKLTPRLLLQTIGTDLFRNQLHPNVWVNSTFADYRKKAKERPIGGMTTSNIGANYPNWIITDMRFPNELEAIKQRGGITIRVNRPCFICNISGGHHVGCQKIRDPIFKEHESETQLDNAKFDIVINNDSTIEHLIEKVENKLFKEMKIHEQFKQ